MKQLVILGSTGSIGTQALDVVRKHGFGVTGLSAHSNVQQMERQVREFHPHAVCMVREDAAKDLRQRIADTGTQVLSGEEGLCELVRLEQADMVLNSVIGMVGLRHWKQKSSWHLPIRRLWLQAESLLWKPRVRMG